MLQSENSSCLFGEKEGNVTIDDSLLPSVDEDEECKNDSELKKHGGQDWKFLTNYVEDFSVTTNGLDPPQCAIKAVQDTIKIIDHYPPSDNEPAMSDLKSFIWNGKADHEKHASLSNNLILGNGASELVDIVMRVCKENGVESFRPGPSSVQYMDYQRCAALNQLKVNAFDDDSSDLLSIVNPTNPTGDFMQIDVIKQYIEDHCKDNSFVIVDESMIFWHGPNWRSQSLSNQSDWISNIFKTKGISVFINFSWTKIWKCCGIRIGSMVAPNEKLYKQMKMKQCPWSVNALALAFISAAAKDKQYMKDTWRLTKEWREKMVSEINAIFNDKNDFDIVLHGKSFLSWIWCDTGSQELAVECVKQCKSLGVPIRHALYGYNKPTCIRFGVRKPSSQKVLFAALRIARDAYLANKDSAMILCD